jgi:hypothetical protein
LSFLPRLLHILCVLWQAVHVVMTMVDVSPFGCDVAFVFEVNPQSQIYIKITNTPIDTNPRPFFIKYLAICR